MIARDETGGMCMYGIRALLAEETVECPEAWPGLLKTGKEASDPGASVQARIGLRTYQNTCMEWHTVYSLPVIVKALYVTPNKQKVIRNF